jgi:CubicO group peptidase (beta-lactamase class C family)
MRSGNKPKKVALACKLAITVVLIAYASLDSLAQNEGRQPAPPLPAKEAERITRFERELEQLRTLLKIPGMSAGVVKDGRLIWARGFGYSDYENKVAATPETPYEIASLSKTFGATLLMQLVEQGKLSLDDPMSKFSDQYKGDLIKVRHVLTHTSEGAVPGETYKYNGNLFDNLTDVAIKASGKRYRLLLAENILDRLGTTGTSPGNDYADNPGGMAQLLGETRVNNYLDVLKRLAKPYRLYGADEIVQTSNPRRGIGTATGIISTVVDLAKYDAALDQNLFVRKETQERMWTAAVSNGGKTLPYGLGWMVQPYRGLKLVWHNGYLPDLYSAVILKVPEKRLTFILLANSDALSAPARLGQGNVMNSAFADSFMRTFVFEDEGRAPPPAPRWGAHDKDFRRQIEGLEKQEKGYRYEYEASTNGAINRWLAARRSEARKAIKLDAKIFDAYAGQYQVGTNPPFMILSEGDHLVRQGRFRVEFFPESETVFFAKAVDAQLTFLKDETGHVNRIRIRQGENDFVAQRIK